MQGESALRELPRAMTVAIAAALSLATALALATPAAAIEPLGLIGGPGGGAGQLASPGGVVADGTGSLYVAEANNHRVSQFTTQGGFVRAFGWDVRPGGGTGLEVCTAATGCKQGTPGGEAGQLLLPSGVAIDGAGNLVVADRGNRRVSQFTTGGGFVRAFGWDVRPGGGTAFEICTAATGCKTGVTGGGAGQFATPRSVATDAAGNPYIADSGNNRVNQFTPQGAFVRAFGFDVRPGGGAGLEVCTAATGCQPAVPGGSAGQLNSPRGVALDGAGNIYVTEVNNVRVSQFTSQPAFVRAFGRDVRPGGGTGFEICTAATPCKAGVVGDGPGHLDTPRGVGVGGGAELYVADIFNNRVSQFTTQGGFVRSFGFDVIPGGGTGFEVCTAATGCKQATAGAGLGQLFEPEDIATDCRGAVYVAEGEGERVQRFGEAGTPHPPCPPGSGGAPPLPSNEFSFGRVKKNKNKGTARLPVNVPGPGDLDLAKTKKVKPKGRRAEVEGSVLLAIKSKRGAKRRLKRKGKARVKAKVTYTPDGGEPNTKSKRIKLRLKR